MPRNIRDVMLCTVSLTAVVCWFEFSGAKWFATFGYAGQSSRELGDAAGSA
jgi:hypothetical protein